MFIELHDNLPEHPKTRRACRILGLSNTLFVGLMSKLWLAVLRHAPDGRLDDWDEDDIAYYAGLDDAWPRDPKTSQKFVEALLRVKLLVRDANGMRINDWEQYAAHIKARSRKERDRQRKAAQREREKTGGTVHTPEEMSMRHADAPEQSAPTRTEPEPKPEPDMETVLLEREVDEVAAFHAQLHGVRNGEKSKRLVRARLRDDHFSAEQLRHAIEANATDPWHKERNKHDLAYICQSDIRVNQHLAKWDLKQRGQAEQMKPPPEWSRFLASLKKAGQAVARTTLQKRGVALEDVKPTTKPQELESYAAALDSAAMEEMRHAS